MNINYYVASLQSMKMMDGKVFFFGSFISLPKDPFAGYSAEKAEVFFF